MAEIEVERRGSVAVVWLNRPDALNALTRPMGELYASTLRSLDVDPGVRAIVVTGRGRGFCSGADVSLLSAGPEAIWTEIVPEMEDWPVFVRWMATPVIAAVNGPVAGIGFAYMMCTDVRFAAAEAKIATTFARLGLVAEYGLSWVLPRLVGVGRSLDLLLSGRVITGAQAQAVGLIEHVHPLDEMLEAAVAYATDLAENCSPMAMAQIKQQVYGELDRDAASSLTDTLDRMHRAVLGPDLAEALAARTEKRPASFAPYHA